MSRVEDHESRVKCTFNQMGELGIEAEIVRYISNTITKISHTKKWEILKRYKLNKEYHFYGKAHEMLITMRYKQ